MSTIRVIGSTMGVSGKASVASGTGYYVYRGSQPFVKPDVPETGPANARAMRNRRERILEYGRLQVEEGLTEDQAAERVGAFGRTTRRTYKQEWLALQRREGRDA